MKDIFDLELELDNFILYYNNKIHSVTGYAPNQLKDIDDPVLIEEVQNNIIKSLSSKIKNNKENIKDCCFVLLSANFYKKNNAYIPSNKKCVDEFIIPGIFKKFINSQTALIRVSVGYKDYFEEETEIKSDIKLLNWVDEIVYNYYLYKIKFNHNDNI